MDAARRWRGEPLSACSCRTPCLGRTGRLPRAAEGAPGFIGFTSVLEPQLCLTGVPTHPRQSHVSYLRHLIASRAPVMDEAAIAERRTAIIYKRRSFLGGQPRGQHLRDFERTP